LGRDWEQSRASVPIGGFMAEPVGAIAKVDGDPPAPMKMRRDVFNYFDNADNAPNYAQCGSPCYHFDRDNGLCAIMRSDDNAAAAGDTCNKFCPGQYDGHRVKDGEGLLKPEVGFRSGTAARCENCFWLGGIQCGFFAACNESAPDIFDLDENVNPLGCCDAQTPKILDYGTVFDAGKFGPRNPQIDRDHDGPWLSTISKDGERVYINANLPTHAELLGGDVGVAVAGPYCAHEVAERDAMLVLMDEFITGHDREPNDKEREAIYKNAHKSFGVPAERRWCEKNGVPWKEWNEWNGGEAARIMKIKPKNEPDDADIKPFGCHGELETTFDERLALDGSEYAR